LVERQRALARELVAPRSGIAPVEGALVLGAVLVLVAMRILADRRADLGRSVGIEDRKSRLRIGRRGVLLHDAVVVTPLIDGALRSFDVALVPDVELGGEVVPLLVEDSVVALVAVAIDREPTEGVLSLAVLIDRLVVVIDDLHEG